MLRGLKRGELVIICVVVTRIGIISLENGKQKNIILPC
jgi:uncharacterized protein (DUF779 family)